MTPEGTYRAFQLKYYNDPVGFAREYIKWETDKGLTSYQEEICGALLQHKRIAVRGPRRLGKSCISAILVLWFVFTRDGEDWKVVTTASAWRQLTQFLWPEIHKWARRVDYEKMGRPSIIDSGELLVESLKGRTGRAFAMTSDKATLTEGAHADKVLFIFDESKQIPEEIFDSAEGTLAGAVPGSGREAFVMAVSTPGEPLGRFYDIHKRKPGFEDWWVRHVTKEEVVAANQFDFEWIEARKRQWGEFSSLYQNHVEGEFFASNEAGVIPLAWIERANARWDEWKRKGAIFESLDAVGVDVAGQGKDKTVIALRSGQIIPELRKFDKQETMATAGVVTGIISRYGGKAIVDVNGLGTGLGEKLKENKIHVVAFNNGARAVGRDKSGELSFSNKYSEAWWRLRELLDPTSNNEVALPPDEELTQELMAPHWRNRSDGKIDVEGKDDSWGDESGRTVKQRLGRSPDSAEACVMAYYNGESACGFRLMKITGY